MSDATLAEVIAAHRLVRVPVPRALLGIESSEWIARDVAEAAVGAFLGGVR